MKITLQIIFERMQQYNAKLNLNSDEKQKSYHQMVPYHPEIEWDEDVLLFGKSEKLDLSLENRGIVCIGRVPESLAKKNDFLYFDGMEDIQDVFAEIQKIFLKFYRWEERLREIIRKKKGLDILFAEAAEVFENPMFMHDENFFRVANVRERQPQIEWEYDKIRKEYILTSEVMDDFKVNPDYIATMYRHTPAIYPSENMGYAILYQNLWSNGKYRGRICINELERKIKSGDFYLLEIFAEMVLEYLKMGEIPNRICLETLSGYLINLIERDSMDQSDIDTLLMQYGWTRKDQYVCVYLILEDAGAQTYSIQYHCARLAALFGNTCVFAYQKNIVMLLNQTLNEDENLQIFKSKLAPVLRENLMKAGISTVCNDLTRLHSYYWQALYAFEIGKKIQPTFWYHCFEDYLTGFVLHSALEKLPVNLLCRKEILELKEYDKEHTSNLANTLKYYLKNERSITKTAEALKIHRSTLLYRIERIEEVSKVNLDNAGVRFELLLSFKLLEENRK